MSVLHKIIILKLSSSYLLIPTFTENLVAGKSNVFLPFSLTDILYSYSIVCNSAYLFTKNYSNMSSNK